MALRGDGDTGAPAENLTGYPKKFNGWLEFTHIAIVPSEKDSYDSYSDDEDEEDGEEVRLPGAILIKRIESYYGLTTHHTVLISKSGDTYKIAHPFEEIRKLIHGSAGHE